MDFYFAWIIATIIVLTAAVIIFAISKYIKNNKREVANLKFKISNINPKEEINKEFDRIFYGDLSAENKYLEEWDKIKSPLMIGYLCDGTIKYRHIIATLLNFIQKGYIELIPITEKNNQKNYRLKKKDIEIFGPKVYENIKTLEYNNKLRKQLVNFEISASDIYTINRIIFNDNNEITPNDIIKFYDDEDCEGKESEALKAKLIYLKKLINKEFEIYGIIEKNSFLTTFDKGKLTNIGIVKRSQWLKIANKLKTQTLIANRDAQGIIVWGKYMVYGIALNVCKIAINDIWKILIKNI